MATRSVVPPVDQLIPPSRPTGGLTFAQPPEPADLPSPSDLPSLSPDPSQNEGGAGWSSAGESVPSDPDLSDEPRTSSKASSGGSALSKRALREAARTAVLGAGAVAGEVLTDDAGKLVQLWVTDDTDAAAIGDPLASIASRHGGLGAAGNQDLADAISAAVGLAVYAWKQIERWKTARQLRARASVAQEQAAAADGAGEPEQQ